MHVLFLYSTPPKNVLRRVPYLAADAILNCVYGTPLKYKEEKKNYGPFQLKNAGNSSRHTMESEKPSKWQTLTKNTFRFVFSFYHHMMWCGLDWIVWPSRQPQHKTYYALRLGVVMWKSDGNNVLFCSWNNSQKRQIVIHKYIHSHTS